MDGGDIWAVPDHALDEVALAADITDILGKHYPGYTWGVHVNSEELGGIVHIINADLLAATGKVWGSQLRLAKVYIDPGRKDAIRAAGLILEFAGLPSKHVPGTPLDTGEFWKNYSIYEHKMNYGWGPRD